MVYWMRSPIQPAFVNCFPGLTIVDRLYCNQYSTVPFGALRLQLPLSTLLVSPTATYGDRLGADGFED